MNTSTEEKTEVVTTTVPVLLLTQSEADKIAAMVGGPIYSCMFNGIDIKVVIE